MPAFFTCILNKILGEGPTTSSNDGTEGFRRISPMPAKLQKINQS